MPPKIPGFALSGSSVLTGSPPCPTNLKAPIDTSPRIGGLTDCPSAPRVKSKALAIAAAQHVVRTNPSA